MAPGGTVFGAWVRAWCHGALSRKRGAQNAITLSATFASESGS